MPRGLHFILTVNNPDVTVSEFLQRAKQQGCIAGVAQLEKGASGTPHIQATVSFATQRTVLSVSKKLPGHVELCKNPRDAWDYCSKEDTRIAEPESFGEPPKPRKNVKGETAAYNKRILERGPKAAVDDGLIRIQDLPKLIIGLNQYR